MANIGTTHFKVLCSDESKLHRICDAIQYCISNKEPLTPDSSNYWTGNIFKKLGLEYESDRSFWYEAYIEDHILHIFEEGKWTRGTAMRQLVEQLNDPEDDEAEGNLEVYFYSEEPGCEIFETNDNTGEYFPYEYVFDTEDGTEYCQDFAELCIKVNEFLDEDNDFNSFEDIETRIENYIEEQDDDSIWCSVHEISTDASLSDY